MDTNEDIINSPTDWVAAHIQDYLASDGAKGHDWQGVNALLLTTQGRKSGKLRRTALYYGQDGERYLIVASNGGDANHPAWYLNLTAHAEVQVQVQADKFTAIARTASPEEKPSLWKIMAALFPRYDTYQQSTQRDIPIVILERKKMAPATATAASSSEIEDQKEYNRKLIADFRASRGLADDPFASRPLLLLTTTGAKTAQPRTTPLMYVRDGDRLVIMASAAGAPKDPDWYRNLVAYPEVTVELGNDKFVAQTVTLAGADRQQFWQTIVQLHPFFGEYQAKVERQIPVVELIKH
jgi:deazaflavin-dependent oxidoreductase (nitroreductase family)